MAGTARESERGTCRWKVLRAGQAAVVDATAVEAALAPRRIARLVQAFARRDRERQRPESPASRAEDNTASRRPRAGPCLSLSIQRESTREQAEAGRTASTVCSPKVGLPRGGPAPRSGRSSRETSSLCAKAVAAARAAGLGVERSSGARVVRRLQKPVRGAFPALSRWTVRSIKRAQGRAVRPLLLRQKQGHVRTARQGCWERAREREEQVARANSRLRSQGRASSRWKASWMGCDPLP